MQEISNHEAASYTFILVIVQIVTQIAQSSSYPKGNRSWTVWLFCRIQMQSEPRYSQSVWLIDFPVLLFLIIIFICNNVFNYLYIIVIAGNSVLYVHMFVYLFFKEKAFFPWALISFISNYKIRFCLQSYFGNDISISEC